MAKETERFYCIELLLISLTYYVVLNAYLIFVAC